MNRRFRQIILIGMATVLSVGVTTAAVAYAGSAGTDQDPLVTLSYVEKRIQEALSDMTAQINALKKQVDSQGGTTSGSSQSAVFEVVQAPKGSFIYFGGSTEFIVRSGKAVAIATPNGGLSDLTDGQDIGMGQLVPANHHMLVPRDDGRGLGILDITFILVKGPYTITE